MSAGKHVLVGDLQWAKRGAWISTISPGIIFTSLARDERCHARCQMRSTADFDARDRAENMP